MTKAIRKIATPPADATSVLESGDGWLDDFLPYHLYRVSNLMNLRLQGRLRNKGINLSQWRVLSVLRSYGRLRLSKVVEYTLMEQPTASRVVAQLESDGLLDRRVPEKDSRLMEVALTHKGTATFDDIIPSAYLHQRRALEGLSPKELAAFRATLRAISDNIADEQ
jgi:DNA-binding MarR family transcriptional regulator